MSVDSLVRHFARIGATLEVQESPFVRGRGSMFSIDIQETRKREFYLLELTKTAAETLDFQVLNTRPDMRHLVMMVRPGMEALETTLNPQKFLCGHDEKHWFVATVDNGVRDVRSAMDSLKPRQALVAQQRAGVKAKDIHKRHNAGFIRQGEWFFIPEPRYSPSSSSDIKRNQRLSRGAGSKPHIVEEMVEGRGELVYVNWRTGQQMNEFRYKKALASGKLGDPKQWNAQRLTSSVMVRGTVKHSDHRTITLHGWHRVAMNTEANSSNVRFLD
ncbi:MAG: hypothetical protein U0176_09625 [Bacteroidia bacterium]